MKYFILFFLFITTNLAFAQTQPTVINNHGKGAYGIHTVHLLGPSVVDNWDLVFDPRQYDYQGGTITVQYPQLVKYFKFNYKGEAADGIFVMEYGRFNAQGFIKFQIYLVWPDNSFSYFIAKAYGNKTEVNFYESDLADDRITLDPNRAFGKGGAKVWVMEVVDFEPHIKTLYNAFLKKLEADTRAAILKATGN